MCYKEALHKDRLSEKAHMGIINSYIEDEKYEDAIEYIENMPREICNNEDFDGYMEKLDDGRV